MSDVAPAAAPEAPAAPASPADILNRPDAGTETPAPQPPADPFEGGQTTFDRSYVEKLRQEAASHRTAAKPYKDAFDGLDETDRDAILDFVRTYKTDPVAAGQMAERWAKALTPEERGAVAEAAGVAPDDQPLTRTEFNRLMAEQESQRNTQAAISEMQSEAKTLGVDPESPEYTLLIQAMDRMGTTDMSAAKAEVDKFFQAKIDAYIASKANGAATSPLAPGNAGTAPAPTPCTISNFGDAKSAAAEFLAQLDK